MAFLCTRAMLMVLALMSLPISTMAKPYTNDSSLPKVGTAYAMNGSQDELIEIRPQVLSATSFPPTPKTPPKVTSQPSSSSSSLMNCSILSGSESPQHNLMCPDVQTFNNSIRTHDTLGVEIEWVGGELPLPSSGGPLVLSLTIKNANLTSITSSTPQIQMLQSLQTLNLNGNPNFDVESLVRLGTLSSLTHLYLRGTALSTLESQLQDLLRNLPNLQHLDLADSGIRYLSGSSIFASNKNLQYLDISGNQLHEVIFSEDLLTRLIYLNMSGCGLKNIQVQENPAVGTTPLKLLETRGPLKVLDVSRNQLKHLPLLLVRALVTPCITLDIRDNVWSNSPGKCSLYYLWQYIDTFPDDPTNCSKLHGRAEVLYNEIALTNCGWDTCPQGCQCDKRNKTVDCRNMGMKKIPWLAPSSAEILLLQNNNLTDLQGIESPSWCNLKELNVENNQVEALLAREVKGNCKCLSEESYFDDERKCLPEGLQTLFLKNNRLRNIKKEDCPLLYLLSRLELERNEMKVAGAQACGHLSNLEVFNLSYNNITDVSEADFASLPHVKELIMSHNFLKVIQQDMRSLMTDLKVLDLSYNMLESISHNSTAPDTSLFIKWFGGLESLYLNNNQLSRISYIYDYLINNPSLIKITLDHNPWSCICKDLKVMKSAVSNHITALYSALRLMKCKSPPERNNTTLIDHLDTECVEYTSSADDQVFLTLIACVIIIVIIMLICHSKFWKIFYGRCKPTFRLFNTPHVKKKYDCFVVSSHKDNEMLRRLIIVPLMQRGYSVAWHENVFTPGTWIMESVERAVRNSSRMLIFASQNFVNSRWGRQEIRRGRNEEFYEEEFKIMALVTESLPQELNRDLYEIVALRTHVRLSDRDYFEQICNFLPTPAPHNNQTEGHYMTENDIEALLRRFEETRAKHKQECEALSEFVHTNWQNNKMTINVDIASPCTSQSFKTRPEDRMAMIERFKVSPAQSNQPSQTCTIQTSSLQYSLLDVDENITNMLREENFSRGEETRISCRF